MGTFHLQAGISKFTSCTWRYLNDNELAHVVFMGNADIHYVGTGPLSATMQAQPSSLSPEPSKPCRTLLKGLPGVLNLL